MPKKRAKAKRKPRRAKEATANFEAHVYMPNSDPGLQRAAEALATEPEWTWI